MDPQQRERLVGTTFAVAAFVLWGVSPLYWKLLQGVPPAIQLGQRVVWTFLLTLILVSFRGHLPLLRTALAERRQRYPIILCALTLTSNWFFYLYAVATNHLVEASLGYYINPLLSVLFGVVFLKERLQFWQVIALITAAAGVIILTIHYGHVPWISLILAASFGLYGLIKKANRLDSRITITAESMVLTPLALLFLIGTFSRSHVSYLGRGVVPALLLVASGIVTAVPLIWFSKATERIPLSRVGFAQYLTPSGFLLLGVAVYHEPFSTIQLVSFACIWAALILFTLSGTRMMLRTTPPPFRPSVEEPNR